MNKRGRKQGVALKRKEPVNDLEDLKTERRHLETDVDGLVKSGDEFAQKAEEMRQLVWITESNMLRAKLWMLWRN